MADYYLKGANEPDSDPEKRDHKDITLDDLQDPWWHTPCEDCGEVPIKLVPFGITSCKCIRDKT